MKKNVPETERLCRFCEWASALHGEDQMLCRKRGVVSPLYVCRAFRYDPLKRDPGGVWIPEPDAVRTRDIEIHNDTTFFNGGSPFDYRIGKRQSRTERFHGSGP